MAGHMNEQDNDKRHTLIAVGIYLFSALIFSGVVVAIVWGEELGWNPNMRLTGWPALVVSIASIVIVAFAYRRLRPPRI
jgi:hypothetical protein